MLAAELTGGSVAWSSSNTAVATVSSAGLVSGVAAGSATIQPTTELTLHLHATSEQALQEGDFALSIQSVSRAAGRFRLASASSERIRSVSR